MWFTRSPADNRPSEMPAVLRPTMIYNERMIYGSNLGDTIARCRSLGQINVSNVVVRCSCSIGEIPVWFINSLSPMLSTRMLFNARSFSHTSLSRVHTRKWICHTVDLYVAPGNYRGFDLTIILYVLLQHRCWTLKLHFAYFIRIYSDKIQELGNSDIGEITNLQKSIKY